MVQIRKPVKLSENIIDLRVRQSPRGSIPMSVRKMRQTLEEEMQRLAEENLRAAMRLAAKRSRRR